MTDEYNPKADTSRALPIVDEVTMSRKRAAIRQQEYLKAYFASGFAKFGKPTDIRQFIFEYAFAVGDEQPPSVRTFQRWLKMAFTARKIELPPCLALPTRQPRSVNPYRLHRLKPEANNG